MTAEKIPTSQEPDDAFLPKAQTGRRIGPMSDYFEQGGPTHYPVDLDSIQEKLESSRESNAEVDVTGERQSIGEDLEQVSKMLEEKKALASARAGLGIDEGGSGEIAELEGVKEKLEEREEKLTLAEEFNDVLDSMNTFSDEDVESLAQTGRLKDGRELWNKKKGESVHSDVAKELAHLYKGGARRVTWKMLDTVSKVVDAVLHDIVSAVKGTFGIGRRPAGGGQK